MAVTTRSRRRRRLTRSPLPFIQPYLCRKVFQILLIWYPHVEDESNQRRDLCIFPIIGNASFVVSSVVPSSSGSPLVSPLDRKLGSRPAGLSLRRMGDVPALLVDNASVYGVGSTLAAARFPWTMVFPMASMTVFRLLL